MNATPRIPSLGLIETRLIELHREKAQADAIRAVRQKKHDELLAEIQKYEDYRDIRTAKESAEESRLEARRRK